MDNDRDAHISIDTLYPFIYTAYTWKEQEFVLHAVLQVEKLLVIVFAMKKGRISKKVACKWKQTSPIISLANAWSHTLCSLERKPYICILTHIDGPIQAVSTPKALGSPTWLCPGSFRQSCCHPVASLHACASTTCGAKEYRKYV